MNLYIIARQQQVGRDHRAGQTLQRDRYKGQSGKKASDLRLLTDFRKKRIRQAQKRGYFVTLLFLSLSTPEQAVARVAKRVEMGGHDIPTDVIYRRYEAGLSNLFQLYMPVVDSWSLYDNSDCPAVHIASGLGGDKVVVYEEEAYRRLQEKYSKLGEGQEA